MFTGKILPKMKFSIAQAVNPHIQQSANKFAEKAVELPANVSKKATNTTRKVLNKDITLRSQPSADTVVLSSGTAQTTKTPKTDNHNRGKNIKNVLENHFSNEIDTALNEVEIQKKQENLKQLVKKYEKKDLKRQTSLEKQRTACIKLMEQDGIEKAKTAKQIRQKADEDLGHWLCRLTLDKKIQELNLRLTYLNK